MRQILLNLWIVWILGCAGVPADEASSENPVERAAYGPEAFTFDKDQPVRPRPMSDLHFFHRHCRPLNGAPLNASISYECDD